MHPQAVIGPVNAFRRDPSKSLPFPDAATLHDWAEHSSWDLQRKLAPRVGYPLAAEEKSGISNTKIVSVWPPPNTIIYDSQTPNNTMVGGNASASAPSAGGSMGVKLVVPMGSSNVNKAHSGIQPQSTNTRQTGNAHAGTQKTSNAFMHDEEAGRPDGMSQAPLQPLPSPPLSSSSYPPSRALPTAEDFTAAALNIVLGPGSKPNPPKPGNAPNKAFSSRVDASEIVDDEDEAEVQHVPGNNRWGGSATIVQSKKPSEVFAARPALGNVLEKTKAKTTTMMAPASSSDDEIQLFGAMVSAKPSHLTGAIGSLQPSASSSITGKRGRASITPASSISSATPGMSLTNASSSSGTAAAPPPAKKRQSKGSGEETIEKQVFPPDIGIAEPSSSSFPKTEWVLKKYGSQWNFLVDTEGLGVREAAARCMSEMRGAGYIDISETRETLQRFLHEMNPLTSPSDKPHSVTVTLVGRKLHVEEIIAVAFRVRRPSASRTGTQHFLLPLGEDNTSALSGPAVPQRGAGMLAGEWTDVIRAYTAQAADAQPLGKPHRCERWFAFSKLLSTRGFAKICADVRAMCHLVLRCPFFIGNPMVEVVDPLVCAWMLSPDYVPSGRFLLPDASPSAVVEDLSLTAFAAALGVKVPEDVFMPSVQRHACILEATCDGFMREIGKHGMRAALREQEMPLIAALAAMEINGIAFESSSFKTLCSEIEAQATGLEAEAYTVAGKTFLLTSPKQVAEVLYEHLQLPAAEKAEAYNKNMRKGEKRHASSDEKSLQAIAALHPLPGIILQHRKLMKLLTGFLQPLLKSAVNSSAMATARAAPGGHVSVGSVSSVSSHFTAAPTPTPTHPASASRIHAELHQTSTGTGRLSSSNPNLQNLPSSGGATEGCASELIGHEVAVRSAFTSSSPRHILISIDYSQIEMRLMAHVSGDENLCRVFSTAGADVYKQMAARVFRIPLPDVSDVQRKRCKTVVLALMYGQGPHELAGKLGISDGEAYRLRVEFLNAYPGVQRFMNNARLFALKHGYVTTLAGRKRWLPDISATDSNRRGYAERQAVNTVVQGSAADIMKFALLLCAQHVAAQHPRLQARLLLQIHDELLFECVGSEIERRTFIGEVVTLMTVEAPRRLSQMALGPHGWAEAAPADLLTLLGGCPLLSVPLTVNVEQGTSWGSMAASP